MFVCIIQEEQVQKVRTSNALKFQQLEAAVQEKLEQAQTRRSQLEQEQKEKLRNYVSNVDKQNRISL
jgi:stathmin